MNQNLPFEVLRQLRAQGKTLATAESCTGGLIGKLLTDVPGSSEVYMGGVISYTNGVKHRLLGVSEDTLRVYTAVSPGRMAMGQGGPSGSSISGSIWRASRFHRSCI